MHVNVNGAASEVMSNPPAEQGGALDGPEIRNHVRDPRAFVHEKSEYQSPGAENQEIAPMVRMAFQEQREEVIRGGQERYEPADRAALPGGVVRRGGVQQPGAEAASQRPHNRPPVFPVTPQEHRHGGKNQK